MAKVVKRDAAGNPTLEYTEYDTTVDSWAKAPKTSLDTPFQVQKARTLDKPDDVKYYDEKYKAEATALAQKRMDAYARRQSNEYIRTGAKAPDDVIKNARVDAKLIQQAKVDHRGRSRGQFSQDSYNPDSAERQDVKPSTSDVGSGMRMGFAPGTAKGATFVAASNAVQNFKDRVTQNFQAATFGKFRDEE